MRLEKRTTAMTVCILCRVLQYLETFYCSNYKWMHFCMYLLTINVNTHTHTHNPHSPTSPHIPPHTEKNNLDKYPPMEWLHRV